MRSSRKNFSKNNGRGGPQRSKSAVTSMGRAGNSFSNVARTLFPVKTVRRLVYHESVQVSSTSGVAGTYVFSCNGLYDPNITGTGHQPAGFDQIMLFYNHYYVMSSKITVTARNFTADVYPTFLLSVNADSTPITDPNELQEDGSSIRVRLGKLDIDTSMQSLTMGCNVAKFGGAKYLEDSTQYQGSIAANPAEQSYFHLTTMDPEKNTTHTLGLDVTIVFEAAFIEPRDVAPSLQKRIDDMTLEYYRGSSVVVERPQPEEKGSLAQATSWFRSGKG